MRTLLKFFGVILLSVVIFSGCNENTSETSPVSSDQGSLLKGGKVVESVTGSGNFVSGGTLRVFTFNAKRYADGSVDGHYNLIRTQSGIHYSGTITCFTINGNEAYFVGVIDNSNVDEPDLGVGAHSWWAVRDNGQGKNSPADQITFTLNSADPIDDAFFDQFCEYGTTEAPEDNPINYGWYDVEAGNIVIHN
jgi:hypothetical protein